MVANGQKYGETPRILWTDSIHDLYVHPITLDQHQWPTWPWLEGPPVHTGWNLRVKDPKSYMTTVLNSDSQNHGVGMVSFGFNSVRIQNDGEQSEPFGPDWFWRCRFYVVLLGGLAIGPSGPRPFLPGAFKGPQFAPRRLASWPEWLT